ADDADVARHREPVLVERPDGPDGGQVVDRDDRGEVGATGEQSERAPVAGLLLEVRLDDEPRVDVEPGGREPLPVAGGALARDGDLRAAPDVRDPPVPEVDEVLDRQPPAGAVVARDGGGAGGVELAVEG